MGFPDGSVVKNPPGSAGDADSVPESTRFPGKGNGNPLQYAYLENPMDYRLPGSFIHGITKSGTRLKN